MKGFQFDKTSEIYQRALRIMNIIDLHEGLTLEELNKKLFKRYNVEFDVNHTETLMIGGWTGRLEWRDGGVFITAKGKRFLERQSEWEHLLEI